MNKNINGYLAVGLLAVNTVVQAATFDVESVSELRLALNSAANNGESNIVNLVAGTYLTTEDGGGTFLYNAAGNHNLTIQDADLATPNDVILDGASLDEILVLKNESSGGEFIINGLTIQNGAPGLRVETANLTIDQSQFIENVNATGSGGGLYFNGYGSSSLTIDNSRFERNSVTASNTYGGGIYSGGNNITISNSTFDQNSSNHNGGAIYFNNDIYFGEIKGNSFIGNVAKYSGGAISGRYSSKLPSILNSTFTNNSAEYEGVISGIPDAIMNSTFEGNSAGKQSAVLSSAKLIQNSIFKNNTITGTNITDGWTVTCSSCQIINSLFDNNSVGFEVKLYSGTSSTSNVIANSIFINTTNSVLGSHTTSTKINLKNNFIDASKIDLLAEQLFQLGDFFSNDAGLDGDYNLLAGSALIDAGFPESELFTLPEIDFAGHARIVGQAVDIGPLEFGSSFTHPQISLFSLEAYSPKNLQALTFKVAYSLFENRTMTNLELDPGTGVFEPIELINDELLYTFIEPGKKVLRLKLVDSAEQESISTLNIDLAAQSIASVIIISQNDCFNSPTDCNIEVESYYASGYSTAISDCENDPLLCGVNTETYFKNGKSLCINDPASCGIKADFDYTQLPSTASIGWKLMGTSEPIFNMSQFNNVKVVWAQKNGSWYAYSPDSSVTRLLADKNIPVLTSLPAYSGFWVTK